MKKNIIILCLMALLSGTAFAQIDTVRSNKNEFSIGYGVYPASSLNFTGAAHFHPETDHLGAFFATYTYRINRLIGIGVTFCHNPIHFTYSDLVNGENTVICSVSENSFSIIPHLKLNWLNTKHVNLYSKVAIGGIHYVTYQQEEYYPNLYEITPYDVNTILLDAFQITPVGIEIGTKQYAGFLQIGDGMEGMICIGFRYGLKDEYLIP